MNLTSQIAKHVRDVYFGGNWTAVNLKDTLADVTWLMATKQVYDLNTIATLVFHMDYFVVAASSVLKGEPLDAHDKYSFAHPSINSVAYWENFLGKILRNGEEFASLVAQMPDEKVEAVFADEKYGTYYRNLNGIIEHIHYHLGQIVIIKKLILAANPVS